MSVLPAGQPLHRFLPDFDDLLHDPRAYLQQGPIIIGPRRMYHLAALFIIPGLLLLLSAYLTEKRDDRIAVGIGLLLGGGVWAFWSLLLRGHRLGIHPEGVEVRHFDRAIWCPWALFNTEGAPFVPETDSPRMGLVVPINPEAIPFLELRRHDATVAYGAQATGPQLLLNGRGEAVLPGRYELAARDLGELLLQLGRRLGRELPKGAPPREAYAAPRDEALASAPGPGGWITVPLSQVAFPSACCACGQDTDTTLPLIIQTGAGRVAGALVSEARRFELAVPLCDDCRRRYREGQQRGGIVGMALGALAGAALVRFLAGDVLGQIVPLVGGLTGGALIGYMLGIILGVRRPLDIGGYSPTRNTISLRFRNPDYAVRVLDATHARMRRS